ncbi:uncharacterized protein BDR25DRAFT_339876 [Lindgomyces ingoldianus]|uniref:Uncharacterized protein n=1 Tax=Lindgomyces ingoldianus TaxID=673940 RepID=A0ACB6RBV4_9PLEO|nr:uncharacterized protein BDR25DRAFT_339876 [Lindgomyces ingoldianus]KAF2475956.1 hypothetical protein BDR25DRAFT_339876 [Lindgomyces ingoldianus]
MEAPLPPRYHPNGIICHRVQKRSRYAKVWYRNQESSPFLRLPAEIRCMIYEHLLGGKTIYVESRDRTAVFRKCFQCVVYRQGVNPFNAQLQCETTRPPFEKCMTLLNVACRQLYKETALLPYRRNTWAFSSRRVFLDFAGSRGPLPSPHRRSLRSLFLRGLPEKPDLKPLIGVKVIWLDCGRWIEKYDVETGQNTHRAEKTTEEIKRLPDGEHWVW